MGDRTGCGIGGYSLSGEYVAGPCVKAGALWLELLVCTRARAGGPMRDALDDEVAVRISWFGAVAERMG